MKQTAITLLFAFGIFETLAAQEDRPPRFEVGNEGMIVIEELPAATPVQPVQLDISSVSIQSVPQQPAAAVTPGRPVEADSTLSAGTKLAAEFSGKWLPVEVLEVKPDGKVRVHWVGWANQFDEDMDRSRLRFLQDNAGGNGPVRRNGKSKMVPVLPKEFEAHDKNGDGQIGMYEWERSKRSEFTKLDKNGDGFLTPQELTNKGNVFGARSRGGILEKDAIPAPPNMANYNQRVGESFQFLVTGQTGGSVWGTGTYTTDSTLAAVVVHAGLLKAGEKGVVTVNMVQSPEQFEASSANGVNSGAWGQYPAAYTVR